MPTFAFRGGPTVNANINHQQRPSQKSCRRSDARIHDLRHTTGMRTMRAAMETTAAALQIEHQRDGEN